MLPTIVQVCYVAFLKRTKVTKSGKLINKIYQGQIMTLQKKEQIRPETSDTNHVSIKFELWRKFWAHLELNALMNSSNQEILTNWYMQIKSFEPSLQSRLQSGSYIQHMDLLTEGSKAFNRWWQTGKNLIFVWNNWKWNEPVAKTRLVIRRISLSSQQNLLRTAENMRSVEKNVLFWNA